jgi:carboxyl-terminal processing protease
MTVIEVRSSFGGMNRSSTRQPSAARSRRRRHALVVGAVTIVGLTCAGLWAVDEYGPRFNIYLAPPSPQKYADVAIGLLEQGYHADGPEWVSAREAVREAATHATEYSDLYPTLSTAVAAAGGPHSSFLPPNDENAATAERATTPEPTVTTGDGVTTITLPELTSSSSVVQQRYADTASKGIADAAPSTCGWVLDLRGNTGGNMYPMLSGIAALLPNGPALTFRDRFGNTTAEVTIRAEGAGLNGHTITRIAQTSKVTGPVAILQDDRTASSGEVVLTAFRGLDRVETFGAPSAGYTSANTPYRLYDGAQLVVTESIYVDRDDTPLREEAIPADHPTSADEAESAAQAWLTDQGCTTP